MGIHTKVIPQVKAITGKEPVFTADEDGLMITMYRDETTIETVNAPANETVNETVNLTDIQSQIIELIRENKDSTYQEFVQKTGKSRATIGRIIKELTDAGILTRIGSDKTGYWQVNDSSRLIDSLKNIRVSSLLFPIPSL